MPTPAQLGSRHCAPQGGWEASSEGALWCWARRPGRGHQVGPPAFPGHTPSGRRSPSAEEPAPEATELHVLVAHASVSASASGRGQRRHGPDRCRACSRLRRVDTRMCILYDSAMTWIGSYRILNLLEAAITDDHEWPPEDHGVYVVTQTAWNGQPSADDGVLYIGGTTGTSARFVTRVGDLIADILGFYGRETGHHSGGQKIWEYCNHERIHPLDLHIGWFEGCRCVRCAESEAIRVLQPKLNKNAAPACQEHARDGGSILQLF